MKYQDIKNEIKKELEKSNSLAEVARKMYKTHSRGETQEAFRRALYRLMKPGQKKAQAKKKPVKKQEKFELSAWTDQGKIMSLEQFIQHHELPAEHIKEWRLCTHTKVPTYNIAWKTVKEIEIQQDLTQEFIQQAIEKLTRPALASFPEVAPSVYTLRIIITDVHIAMETNQDGFSLYGGVWNEEELKERGTILIEKVLEQVAIYGSFEEIHVIDLGDYMDGWDGMTVRKGHPLPQNMDNKKAFEVGLGWKVWLAHSLAEINAAGKLKFYNVCNDNHSGDFGYIVNYAAKQHLELIYPGLVEVHNLRRFISHYICGKHCFILTHGKDDKNLKFGFKVILDKKGEDKIAEYIRVHNLGGYFITVEKGDSHQQLFDQCTSDIFDYKNYMAFSPSSEWVQTNFKRGRSGFNLQVLDKEKRDITNTPFTFSWKKTG